MISTVSDDQHQILRDILTLYVPAGRFDLDATYGHGGFYRHGVPAPVYRYDLDPDAYAAGRTDCVTDCRDLPHAAASIDSIIFDPPFIHAHGQESVIGQRFGSYPTQHALRSMCFASLVEFYRILKPKGILVVKCQDTVESGKQVWNTDHIYQLATNLGFEKLDQFILTARHRIQGHNHARQVHARRFHCEFQVYQKGSRK